MKKISTTVLAILTFFYIIAQQIDTSRIFDPKAEQILDKVSKKYNNYQTLRLYFSYQIYDNKDTSNRLKKEMKGYLFVKGKNKYKLIIPDIEIFCDGNKIYSLNKKDKELTITLYDPESQSILTPQKLLYIYNKDFKYLFKGQVSFDTKSFINNKIVPKKRTMYIIDLYPLRPKESEYSIIRLWIEKDTYQLISIKYQAKNGIDYVIDLLEQKPNITIPDILFKYDPKRLPKDTEINDMTTIDQR